MSDIHFPVITHVTVSGYELYPGKGGEGIDWPIKRGVSVVAGVNGLGKTTFLNILLRLLSGPADWRADDGRDLGNLEHSLRGLKDAAFFRSRVSDGAKGATASAEIRFGARKVWVERSLRNLSINELWVDDEEVDATEKAFQAAVIEASGFATMFDYHLVLRLLVFYFEDRRPLVWDRTAQDETLRALFYPTEQAKRTAELIDIVQKLDSDFRNQRVYVNRQDDLLKDAEAAAVANDDKRGQYNSVRTRMRAIGDRLAEIDPVVDAAQLERIDERQRWERAKLMREEVRREYEDFRQVFFERFFPDVTVTGRYILQNLDSGAGCLVCGNKHESVSDRLERCLEEGVCPMCDAPPARQDVRPARKRTGDVKKLEDLQERRDRADAAVDHAASAMEAATERWHQLFAEQSSLALDRQTLEAQLGRLRQLLPPDDEELAQLRATVAAGKRDLAALKAKQRTAEDDLREQIAIGRKAVKDIERAVVDRFRANAAAFLAERCELVVEEEERKFGTDTDDYPMPRFTVRLTSGVFKDQPQPRHDDTDVSESQKEFIDLAFRLALMSAASGSRPAMMVIETPEASLDSLFIARAGRLLAKFASGGGRTGNRLIASSNLNKEDMIPALFGLASEEEYAAWWKRRKTGSPPGSAKAVPLPQRLERTLNLLDEAAENRAVESNRAGYEARFDHAIDPAWSKPPRRARR